MKSLRVLLLLCISIIATSLVHAQEKKETEIKRIVEAQNYVFVAQTVSPQSGRTRQLTPEYHLTVKSDSIVSDLPYFGRAYAAPTNLSDGGIKFTSTRFEYTKKEKGENWEIAIKIKDAPDVQQLYLDIFDNGNASLRVNSTNRQSISFSGYIVEGKVKEKKAF